MAECRCGYHYWGPKTVSGEQWCGFCKTPKPLEPPSTIIRLAKGIFNATYYSPTQRGKVNGPAD